MFNFPVSVSAQIAYQRCHALPGKKKHDKKYNNEKFSENGNSFHNLLVKLNYQLKSVNGSV